MVMTLAVSLMEVNLMDIKPSASFSESVSKPRLNPSLKYQVVHVVPGRIRFRVSALAENLDYTQHLEKIFTAIAWVTQVRIRPAASSIAIYYEFTQENEIKRRSHLEEVLKTAHKLPIPPVLQTQAKTSSEHQNPKEQKDKEDHEEGLKLPLTAVALALLGLGLPIPTALIATTVGLAAVPVAKRAYQSINRDRKLNLDCLDLLAIVLTASQGNLLTPALMMTLHEIGDTIRNQTARSSNNNVQDLLASLAKYAWIELANGEKIKIAATDVKVGDTVIVYPGEQIPVDGTILHGNALIDQQKLTGEAMPVFRQVGEKVYASTLVREGQVYLRAERVAHNTRAAASIELVQNAPLRDTRMANHAATVADKTILPALVFSGLVFAATRSPARAASILTLDFMTGIRVSLPTAYLAALNHATRHGAIIRSGRALEKLAQVDTLVFDKTGTLTKGEIEVVGIETFPSSLPARRILELVASAEQRLTHPVAIAICEYARQQGVEPLDREEWHYEIGGGVRAQIDGCEVLVGSDRFLESVGINLDKACYCQHIQSAHTLRDHISTPDSPVYIAINGKWQGVISYTDPLRPESIKIINQLQSECGIEIHLLTGDNQARAMVVAQELGIKSENVHAEAFPERKAEIISLLTASGRTVGYTGDGVNDSAALAYADVSISFANGSEVARETADVVLMDNDLTSLIEAMKIAQETKQVIDQNIAISVMPNLGALGLASTIGIHPLTATVIHNGSAIAAGLNALRPLMHRDPPR